LEELEKASKKIRELMEDHRGSLPEKNFDAVIHILKSFKDKGKCYSFGMERINFGGKERK